MLDFTAMGEHVSEEVLFFSGNMILLCFNDMKKHRMNYGFLDFLFLMVE
jgi:hypothetical protein